MSGAVVSETLARYYSLHSRIYDLTRWTFLFGRGRLVRLLQDRVQPRSIMEIGCGTGANLLRLGQAFPAAQLLGIDASEHMLAVAKRKLSSLAGRVSLKPGFYDAPLALEQPPDLILCSYSLSMINPGYDRVICAAARDLAPKGVFAAVDFHRAKYRWFRNWMQTNHVRMEGQLVPLLRGTFEDETTRVRPAYLGTWSYFLFIGRRR